MERFLRGAIICLLSLGLMKSEAFDVQVKDESNHTCIHASMSVNFTIKYETESGTNKSISFVAPDDVTTSGSTCGSSEAAALLVVNFMNNHSWSVNFTRDSTVYSIDVIVFTYNTNDSTLFPDAKRKGLLTTATSVNDPIPINATYTCVQHKDIITENVVQDYWNVSLLAYAQDVTVIRGSFNRRRRNSIFVTVTLFLVSILILTVGLAATTRSENVTVGGYYPGVILGFGSILGIIGSNLIENKRQMLVASIVFISFGVIAAFCCAIVDGVFAARHLDLRPIYAGRCRYFTSAGEDQATDTVEVTCQMPTRGSCSLKIKSNTCYCCELYNCGRAGISGLYYEYIDVKSCQDVIHLYHLLWSVTILNIVGLFLGIITAAILGGFKDMNPTIPAISCIVETPRPTVQYNTRPPVPSYNTYYHSTPHLPPYTAYDLQHSTVFPASTPSGLSDDPNSTSQSGPSFMWPSSAPPRYSPPYFPPDEKPPPYTP